MRRFHLLYKFFSTKQPACIHDLLPLIRKSSGRPNTFNTFSFRREYFKNSFFRGVVSNWNKLYPDISVSINYTIFHKSLPKFIRLVKRKPYHINEYVGIKLLTRLRLRFSHLHENKFRHNFKDMLNPLCLCSIEPASTTHFFLRCHFYY